MNYWRSTSGDFEVDCILGNDLAVEIKSTDRFQDRHLRGLQRILESIVSFIEIRIHTEMITDICVN
jgi:hypothetical protein